MIWKRLPSIDNDLEVSDTGSLRRLLTYFSQYEDKDGYLIATVRVNKNVKVLRIHQLVALAFIGECPANCVVDHKDTNRKNNYAFNLRYLDTVLNSAQGGYTIGPRPKSALTKVRMSLSQTGSLHSNTNLREDDVINIRRLHSLGNRIIDLAAKFNTSQSVVNNIIARRAWKHI